MIRVLTVDDHPLLREGIAALVNAKSDMKFRATDTFVVDESWLEGESEASSVARRSLSIGGS